MPKFPGSRKLRATGDQELDSLAPGRSRARFTRTGGSPRGEYMFGPAAIVGWGGPESPNADHGIMNSATHPPVSTRATCSHAELSGCGLSFTWCAAQYDPLGLIANEKNIVSLRVTLINTSTKGPLKIPRLLGGSFSDCS